MIRSFNQFVVVEKEKPWKSPAEKLPCGRLLYKLKCVCKHMMIIELLVEAAGVELFRVLITRNLLILGTATTAKKAPLPDPLYVYCTKMLFALVSNRHHKAATVSHRFVRMDRKSTYLPAIP
jgi:hypothetical protein